MHIFLFCVLELVVIYLKTCTVTICLNNKSDIGNFIRNVIFQMEKFQLMYIIIIIQSTRFRLLANIRCKIFLVLCIVLQINVKFPRMCPQFNFLLLFLQS